MINFQTLGFKTKKQYENSVLFNNILKNLNELQQQIVTHKTGPILVSASPGSGKTRTIVHKVACLILHHKIESKKILVVTFTKKASNEISNRIDTLLGCDENYTVMGTFHSICYRFLKAYGILESHTIIDEIIQKDIIKNIIETILKKTSESKNIMVAINKISCAKNELFDSKNCTMTKACKFTPDEINIYKQYEEYMNVHNYVDYDDLLKLMVMSIRNNEEFKYKIQNRFEYILVDEFQDTNGLQFEITQAFAKGLGNLTIVGDIDQSIYGWRFADYTNIIKFQNIYPNHTKYLMQQNYRSTQNIINCSNSIIEQVANRLNSKVWTNNVEGEKVTLKKTIDRESEANFVVDQILALNKEKNIQFNEMAILIRTHFCSREFEETLSKKKVPYKIVGAIKFYEREEVQDILSYLKFIINQKDTLSFERIINIPKRCIGNIVGKKIGNILVNSGWTSLIENPTHKTKLKSFTNIINTCLQMIKKDYDALSIVNYILEQTQYKTYLENKYEKEKFEDKWNNIDELVNVASKFHSIESLLMDIQLVGESDEKNEANNRVNNRVTISSIHSAKGLEWDAVFVTTITEDNIPHYFALKGKASELASKVDEERRLLYVATSRARKYLTLSYCEKVMSFGKSQNVTMSRFLLNLPTAP